MPAGVEISSDNHRLVGVSRLYELVELEDLAVTAPWVQLEGGVEVLDLLPYCFCGLHYLTN